MIPKELSQIVKDLLSFFNEFECLHETKRMIEKKCDIKKEHEHKCWPEDDIKRAWEETKRMDIKSRRRRHWARIIILQLVKSFVCDTCKQNAAQKNPHVTTDQRTPNPEDRPSQSKAEPETVGAAGEVEQTLGERKKISKVSKLTASSTDVAPSPTEVNPNNSETKNAALVNEEVNNCQNVEYYELHAADVNDKENIRWENGLRSTCGKAQSMKGNSEDIPRQSNAEPETVGAAGGVKQSAGGNHPTSSYLWQTGRVSQVWPETQFLAGSQATVNYPGVPYSQSWTGVTLGSQRENMCRVDETIYIYIPLSVITENEPTDSLEVPNVRSRYKLINGFPSDTGNTDIRKSESYAMSFDNYTRNAEWVYEILNRDTLVNNCMQGSFGHGYDRGHLAAARNHSWCREAYNDTYLFSNMIPQNHLLNIRTWKDLENRCRSMFRDSEIHNVHVYTGPLYLRDIDYRVPGGKVIPTHLFKVIIVENGNGTVREPECYVMPNEESQTTDLNVYRVNIEDLERVSGLRFLERRPNLEAIDRRITVRLQGEDLNEIPRYVNLGVRIV